MDEAYHEDPSASAMVATSSYKIDPNWYSDTGATDHITSELDRLAVHEQYNGGDKVHVGNGTGLRILHTGHASLRTASHSVALRNILQVPEISKNLLSVHKLARDNDVFFEYHPWHFSIKDRQTGASLLDGQCEAGLYPLKSSDVATLNQALLSESISRVQWHARLGHPSFQTVQSILRLNNISFTSESSLPVCSACQVAKSHQLPYVTSVHQSSAPLQMIFSDVWGPAPQSVGGFKYYISFIDYFSKFCWVYLMHDLTEAPCIFREFQLHVERLLDAKIKCVQSDWGGEYHKMHNTFSDLLALLTVSHAHMHISRTVLLNENIAIL
jgi:histone deacetylase 1/2